MLHCFGVDHQMISYKRADKALDGSCCAHLKLQTALLDCHNLNWLLGKNVNLISQCFGRTALGG